MTRFAIALVLLTAIYALALASLNPWDLLGGALLSAALLALFRKTFPTAHHPVARPALPVRLVFFIPFVARVGLDVLAGAWGVALVMLHLRPLRSPGLVTIPIDERSRQGVVVTALVTTLSPGSYFLEVDWERGEMLFHFLDAADPEAIRRDRARFYQRYQRHVFP